MRRRINMVKYFAGITIALIALMAFMFISLDIFAQDDLSPADRKNPLLNNEKHKEMIVNVTENPHPGGEAGHSERYMVLVNGETNQVEYYWGPQGEWVPAGSFTALKEAYLKQQQNKGQDNDQMAEMTVE
jgi:hypothetical protein